MKWRSISDVDGILLGVYSGAYSADPPACGWWVCLEDSPATRAVAGHYFCTYNESMWPFRNRELEDIADVLESIYGELVLLRKTLADTKELRKAVEEQTAKAESVKQVIDDHP